MTEPRLWAVLPAAGDGRRMGTEVPKQYLPLAGRMVIEHTLDRILTPPLVSGVVVAVSAQDRYWPHVAFAQHPNVSQVVGGAQRSDSVLNALSSLARRATPEDWVLVHDVARPCVRRSDIDKLIRCVRRHPVGGLLGILVSDTMKRSDASGEIIETVDRHRLWRAFTPQMFRLGPLLAALQSADARGEVVTDEASAMELSGYRPLLVEGSSDNIKITQPDDLALAAYYLQQQAGEAVACRSTG